MTEQIKVNPLMERLRIPGETFRLPSQGQFYTHGELDDSVKNGEVQVNPMTAVDEIILNTPDKLLSGKALLEIISRCVPQVRDPGAMLAKDVDFLMVCLRMVSFGTTMDVSYTHDCEHAREHTYTIDLQQMMRKSKPIDATTVQDLYTVTLPNDQRVFMRPLTYTHIVDLYSAAALNKTDDISQDEAELFIINTLASAIERVDDVVDPLHIREWVIGIPLGWKRKLEQTAQTLSHWGVDFTTQQTCIDCGKSMQVQVSANPVSFFT